MSVAPTVERELLRSGVDFQLLHHGLACVTLESARLSRVPPAHVAKGVVLTGHAGHVLAVIPADAMLELGPLRLQAGRELVLAGEVEAAMLFHDCVFGAVPPLGAAYGIETWLDERLLEAPDIYFDAGDHELLVRLRAQDFLQLVREANIGRFTRPGVSGGPRRLRPAGRRRPVPPSCRH